ncbi:hypothetical protein QQ045_031961 [Rhodiola kirilowii]
MRVGRRLDPGMRAAGFREVEIVAGYVFLRSGIDRRESERASMASWLSRILMFSTNRQQMLTPSTQSAAPCGSRFKCSVGQAGFFTRLGRLIKEKAKSDVDKLFSGFTKTRDNLAVIDEVLLYWNLADTDRVLEELEERGQIYDDAVCFAESGMPTLWKIAIPLWERLPIAGMML